MKAAKTYLKGQSIFIISIIVVLLTIVVVYINGENQNRSITSNFYISLLLIGIVLFLFISYGLFKGVGLKDNFPKFESFKIGKHISSAGELPNVPSVDISDGIGGLIISILVWIAMTILVFLLLLILEFAIWFSIFIIITMLYWLFFRALKLVFSNASVTQGKIATSVLYALAYTVLYLGWIFAIVFFSQKF